MKNAQLSTFPIHSLSGFLELKNVGVESIGGTKIYLELALRELRQLETLKLQNYVIELGVGIEEDFKAKLKALVLKEVTFVETEPNNYHSVDFMSLLQEHVQNYPI